MSNLESSWEETIVKLAQAGNLRAVAFWLNRHLVVQGICVQALTDQPGRLTLQILCRQAPDRDKLVRFICHQLGKLNSSVIRSVQFRTQLVGSSELLWTQTVNLTPVAPSPAIAEPVRTAAAAAEPGIAAREANRAADSKVAVAEPAAPVSAKPSAKPSKPSGKLPAGNISPHNTPPANTPPANPSAAVGLQPAPAKKPVKKTVKKSSQGKGIPPKRGVLRSASPKTQPSKQKSSHWLEQSQQQLQRSGRQLRQSTERSIQWFQRQKPRKKAVILGSSAIAAFLLGCGFELLRYQAMILTARNQNPEAAAGASYEGMVKTAIEQVPVIQFAAANPENPAITLLFSNAVTLTEASGQPGIAAQQNADMLITSLNAPLAGATSQAGDAASPAANSPQVAESQVAESPAVNSAESSPDGSAQVAAPGESTPSPSPEGEIAANSESSAANSAADSIAANPSEDSASAANASESSDPNSPEELPPVKLPPVTLQQLQANRVGVVNLASNQLMQSGGDALNQTIKSLSQASIYPIGAGADQQSARRPQIFSLKGKRIAYLGYSDVSLQTASQNSAGLNTSVSAQVEADIKSIRSQVDWVIVSYHWNQNLRSYPEDWQVSLTHAAIDHGADLVVGYHPTVTQGAEVYGGRAIVYSLGSRLDPYQIQEGESSSQSNQQYETLALKLSLLDKQMQVELLPVRVSSGQTELLNAETGASILDYLQQASSLFRQPLRSPTTLDAQIRLTLPAAPNSDQPFSAPFTTDSPSAPSTPAPLHPSTNPASPRP